MRILLSKPVAICLICINLFFMITVQANYVRGQDSAIITGTVRDEDGNQLSNASVLVLNQAGAVVRRSTTDSQGKFSLTLDQEDTYFIYALLDRSDTTGIDYVPSLSTTYVQVGSTTSLTFVLKRGASLYLDGNVRFVESTETADQYRFTVMRPDGPLGDNLVTTYGSRTDLVKWLDFNERLVVIPANTAVIITIFAQNIRAHVSDTFTIEGKTAHFNLSQGETLHVDVTEYSLNSNLARLRQMLDSAFSILSEAEHAGFLVAAERQDLLDAYGLVDSSLASIKTGLYDESFAKMRGAYISISKTENYLGGLFQISSQTVLLLPFFFMFIASALAHLITERESSIEIAMPRRKTLSLSVNLLITVIIYAVLFFSFYSLFPGSHIASQTWLVLSAFLALIVRQFASVVLPRIFSEKVSQLRSIQFGSAIIVAFSMAFRNLRRRKLRTILSLVNMTVLIFGFITFTSISPSYGLITQPLRPAIPTDALLIRSVPPYSSLSFLSLPSSFITWLQGQQDVFLISPKAENIPLVQPIGSLYTNASEEILVLGVVGIRPCPELIFTHLHRIVTEGDYLRDDDDLGILINSNLHRILKIGDKLHGFGKEFVIRGFFDPKALEILGDVDGQPFIPKRLDPAAGPLPLRGDQVIIINYDTALTMPNVVISRVNVQLENPSPEVYSNFARMVTLITEYRVYISHPGSLHLQLLGRFIEEKGAGLVPFLMVLVILNISTSMSSTVEERRSEIATVSSVGLNPAHIAALFMAEAVVIGFTGGGLGYLLGILGYRSVSNTFFGMLQVREKVSVEWGVIALILSNFTAILASVIPSTRASMITTPSLMRRWRPGEAMKPSTTTQTWITDLPLKIIPRELEPFTRFVLERLHESDFVSEVRLEGRVTERGPLRRISFKYLDTAYLTLGSVNEILIQPAIGDYFGVELRCIPSMKREDIVRKTATDVRKIIFEWGARTS